jgi:hypothetical protein
MKTIGPEAKAVKTEIITQWVSLPTDIADTLAMASPMAALYRPTADRQPKVPTGMIRQDRALGYRGAV